MIFTVKAVPYKHVQQLSRKAEFLKVPNQHQLIASFAVEWRDNESSYFNACKDTHEQVGTETCIE